MGPWQPPHFFIFITILIIISFAIGALADPYETCDIKKIVTYDGKEIISAEVSFSCESKFESEKKMVDNGIEPLIELPVVEQLPMVVSLTEYYNNWMN